MGNKFMSLTGGIQRTAIQSAGATNYLSIAGGSNLRDILFGRAPASRITITDDIDYTASKSLNGDYLISTFGHKLVTVKIDGLDIYGAGKDFGSAGNSVAKFYSRYNIHDNKSAYVTLGLSNSKGTAAYRCVLVSCVCSAEASKDTVGVGAYSLMFIGVKI